MDTPDRRPVHDEDVSDQIALGKQLFSCQFSRSLQSSSFH